VDDDAYGRVFDAQQHQTRIELHGAKRGLRKARWQIAIAALVGASVVAGAAWQLRPAWRIALLETVCFFWGYIVLSAFREWTQAGYAYRVVYRHKARLDQAAGWVAQSTVWIGHRIAEFGFNAPNPAAAATEYRLRCECGECFASRVQAEVYQAHQTHAREETRL